MNKHEVSISTVEDFYEVVKILNSTIGHGKENWTMSGRPLRAIKKTPSGVSSTVIIISDKITVPILSEIKLSISGHYEKNN